MVRVVHLIVRPQCPRRRHLAQKRRRHHDAGNKRQFWIPQGFAHGFVVLSERAIFHYLCTAPYLREADAGIRWNDAQLAVDWPVSEPLLSDKDAVSPFLSDIAPERLPEFVP